MAHVPRPLVAPLLAGGGSMARASANGRAAMSRRAQALVVPLVATLRERGEAAFGRFVRRSDDRRLERTVGSDAGLRILFAGMARRFDPAHAGGFEGDLQYDLHAAGGKVRPWTISVAGDRARARPGRAPAPKLTVGMALADFVRMVGRDLDPGKALLSGRLEIRGDFQVAVRLGEMFGESSAY